MGQDAQPAALRLPAYARVGAVGLALVSYAAAWGSLGLLVSYAAVRLARRLGPQAEAGAGPLPCDRAAFEALEQTCRMGAAACRRLMLDLRREMRRGLQADGAEGGGLKMVPSHVTALPGGDEAGTFFALDLGGTNFRVVKVVLGKLKGEVLSAEGDEVAIPPEAMTGTMGGLFDFMAAATVRAIRKRGGPARVVLGFTFSYPCRQTALAAGTLIEWTKGFDIPDGVGQDVVALLTAALARRGVDATVAALVNDTVGTLAAAKYADDDAVLGVILGTGTNAAYVEKVRRIAKYAPPPGAAPADSMVINMEWGALSSPAFPWLAADREVDAASPNPGKQHFEKFVSGMYLGDIVRRTLIHLAEGHADAAVLRALRGGRIETSHVSLVDGDPHRACPKARSLLLKELEIPAEHCPEGLVRLTKAVCGLVRRRAARMAGAAIAAVLEHVEDAVPPSTPGCGPSRRAVVAVDGGLYQHYARYRADVEEALEDLLGEASKPVELVLTNDGSGLGAALLAASTCRGLEE